MNHYPKHIGDYLKKTIGLTMIQDGAYSRAIDLYYGGEGPLPLKPVIYDDLRCRDRKDRAAVDFILAKFFTETPEGYRHDRCDEEIEKYLGKAAKASASAAIGWAKRKPNAMRTHNEGNANALESHSVGNANQNQNHNQGVKPELCTDQHGLPRSKPRGDKSPVNGQNRPKPGWYRTADGINATGKMLGIEALPGESTPAYKARLFDAIKGH